MTALASSLLAAVPGGLVPTVGAGSAAPTTGGVFEGLLAGMMAGQGEGGALQTGLPTAFPQTAAQPGAQAVLAANESGLLDGAVHLDGPPAALPPAERVDALAGLTDVASPSRAATVAAPIALDAAALPLTAPKTARQPVAPVASVGPSVASPPNQVASTAPVSPVSPPVSPAAREMAEAADAAPAADRAVANAAPDAVPPTGRDRTPPRKTTAGAGQAAPTPKVTFQDSPVAEAAIPAMRLPVVATVGTVAPAETEGDAPSATPAQIDSAPALDAGLALLAAAGLTTLVRAVPKPVVDGEAPTAVAGPRRDRLSAFETFRTTPAETFRTAPAAAALTPTADLAASAAPRPDRSVVPQPGTAPTPVTAVARAATPEVPSIQGLTSPTAASTAKSDAPAIPTADAPMVAPPAGPATKAAIAAPELAAPLVTPTVARAAPTSETEARRATPARPDRRPATAAAQIAAGSPIVAPKGSVAPVEVAAAGLADAAPDVAAIPAAVAEAIETPELVQPAPPAEVRPAALHTIATVDQAAPRGAPETVARLAADIVRKLEGQSTRFDLALDPHGLGRVDVSVEIDRDGKLTALLSFDSAQTAADLRGRSGELRLALEKAGFEVSDSGLSFDMSGQGAGFGQREAGEQNRAWNGRAFQRAQAGAEEADASLAATVTNPARRTSSGVDIRI